MQAAEAEVEAAAEALRVSGVKRVRGESEEVQPQPQQKQKQHPQQQLQQQRRRREDDDEGEDENDEDDAQDDADDAENGSMADEDGGDRAAAASSSTAVGNPSDRPDRMHRRRLQALAQLRAPFPGHPEARLLIYNVQKASNVGPLIRTAVAFALSAIYIVGAPRIKTHGHQHTASYIHMIHFDHVEECVEHLRRDGFTIVGVEIGEKSVSVSTPRTFDEEENEQQQAVTSPFAPKTVFCLGNEATGLNAKMLALCDRLIYIPQFGAGTASLNVATSAGIVFHRFATWARYPEQSRQGMKFVVEPEKRVTSHGPPGASAAAPTATANAPTTATATASDANADAANATADSSVSAAEASVACVDR